MLRAPLLLARAPEPAYDARDGTDAGAHAAYCRPDRRMPVKARASRPSVTPSPHRSDRRDQVPVRHGHPRGAGGARIPGTPAAGPADLAWHMAGRYRLRDALRRADTLARADPPPP